VAAKYKGRIAKAIDEQISSFIDSYPNPNFDVWNQRMLKIFESMYKEVYRLFARATYNELRKQSLKSVGMGFKELWTQEVIQFLRDYGLLQVITITGNTRDILLGIVNQTLQEAIEQGLGTDETANLVVARLRAKGYEYTEFRAERIVRTETVRAANMGHMAGARALPFEVTKEWISAKDNRTRRIPTDGVGRKSEWDHWSLDGAKLDLEKPFTVTSAKGITIEVQQPGEATAPPGFTVNCRCRVAFEAKRDNNGRIIMKNGIR
jgi:hypothetical protein